MNTSIVSSGVTPLAIGSVETFQLQAYLDGLPWDLTGGTVSVVLKDPSDAKTTLIATITGMGAQATWTVAAPTGNWTRAWVVTDAAGRHQVSLPIGFTVIASP